MTIKVVQADFVQKLPLTFLPVCQIMAGHDSYGAESPGPRPCATSSRD